MSKIKELYHDLVRRHWVLGIGPFFQELTDPNLTHQIRWIDSNTTDSWYADPFILNEDENSFEILVEEFPYTTKKGRITWLRVDKHEWKVVETKVLLDLPTHLSFPCYFKVDGRVYVYPENSASGVSNLYIYNPEIKQLEFKIEWCKESLTDAVLYDIDGAQFLLSTVHPNENGSTLKIFRKSGDDVFEVCQEYSFDENKARNAGVPFTINGKLIRPAQISNTGYGEGMVLQEVSCIDGQFSFTDIRRMKSPLKDYPLAFHTMNVYEDKWVVYDAQGYKHKILGPIVTKISTAIKKFVR